MASRFLKPLLGLLVLLAFAVFGPSFLRGQTLQVYVINDSGQPQNVVLRLDAAPAAVQEQILGRLPPDHTATATFRAPQQEASLHLVRDGGVDERSGVYVRHGESGKLKLILGRDGRLRRLNDKPVTWPDG